MFRYCFTGPGASRSLLALALSLLASSTFAHPLGNYSVNQYVLFDLRSDEFRLFYLLDMAEIPSFREMELLDGDMDNAVSDAEIDAYLEERIPQLLSGLELTRDGEALALRLLSQRLEVHEGTGAMPVFNVFLEVTPVDWAWPGQDEGMLLDFRSENHADARGYRESKVLLDGRFEIDYGPWPEKELKYLVLLDWDDKDNPIFQNFNSRFLLDLSPGAGNTLASLPELPDFSWTATARAEEDAATLIAEGGRTFTVGEGPVTQPETVVAEAVMPPAPAGAVTASEPPAPPEDRVTVVQPTRRAEPSRSKRSEHLIGRVSEIIRTKELTLPVVLLAFGIALVLGMGHALAPGHGKTVMAAYLIGERGTVWHAFVLGAIVTCTHVWSVILLGMVTLYAAEQFSEEQVTFWTGVASGIIIVAIGLALFHRRLSAYLAARKALQHGPDGNAQSHVVSTEDRSPPTYGSVMWLGISGGIVPCPAALIVLLLAIKFGRLQLGLLLLLAFSLGLAAILVAIGIAVVKAVGRIRKTIGERSTVLLALPVVSSVLITILGLWVVVWTLLQFNVIAFTAIA